MKIMEKDDLYKHPQYGHVKGKRMLLEGGRVVWPHVVAPRPNTFTPKPGQKPAPDKFELTYLLPKLGADAATDSNLVAITAMKDTMLALFNQGKGTEISIKKLVSDGDAMDLLKYPFNKGMWVIVCKNVTRPTILAKDGTTAYDPALVLGGMKANLVVRPKITDKGFYYDLEIVQMGSDDGQRFGGGRPSGRELLNAIEDEGSKEGGSAAPATTTTALDTFDNVSKKPVPAAVPAAKGTLDLSSLA